MVTDLKDYTNRACFLGHYGVELKDIIESLPKNGVFVDFGANAGLFSLIASKHLTEGWVYSFEPEPGVYEKLVRNLKLNRSKRCTTFNFGVSDRTQLIGFTVNSEHSGGGHITSVDEFQRGVLLVNIAEVANLLNIDLCSSYCLVKIDTEGSEYSILKSLELSKLIQKVDCFYIEIDRANLTRQGVNENMVYTLLEKNGFLPTTDRLGQKHYDEIFKKAES